MADQGSESTSTFLEEKSVGEALQAADSAGLAAPPPIPSVAEEEENPVKAETPEQLCWNTLRGNPGDFDTWVKLLQLVEQQDKTFAAREAFDAFFKHFPYCYGYWKKYADYEQLHSGNEMAKEVYQRGVQAVPLSIDLWLQYIGFVDQTQKALGIEKPEELQQLYEAAVTAAGHDFRSDRLWESYIDWLRSQGSFQQACTVFDRVLSIPTQHYSKHFDRFKELVTSNRPVDVLSDIEYAQLYHDVLAAITAQEVAAAAETPSKPSTPDVTTASTETTADGGMYNGQPVACAGDSKIVSSENGEGAVSCDNEVTATQGEETTASTTDDDADALQRLAEQETIAKRDAKMVTGIREKAIAARYAMHKSTEEEVRKRWSFEEQIKRPYFHVKPLERSQLKNWREYLEFEAKEVKDGNEARLELLYERCLVACALYEDFWMKYVKYMEARSAERASVIYERACHTHLLKKPNIHLAWAVFEEGLGQLEKARDILKQLDHLVPDLVLVRMARISLERRHGELDRASQLFREALAKSRKSEEFNFFSWRYARFLCLVANDLPQARGVMTEAINRDPGNKRLYQQLLHLEMCQGRAVDEKMVEVVFTQALNCTSLSQNARHAFAQRRLQFLEEFGSDVSVLMEAHENYQKLYKKGGSGNRKRGQSDGGPPSKVAKVPDGEMDEVQMQQAQYNAMMALNALQSQTSTPTQAYPAYPATPQWPGMQGYTAPAAGGAQTYPYQGVSAQTWSYPQY